MAQRDWPQPDLRYRGEGAGRHPEHGGSPAYASDAPGRAFPVEIPPRNKRTASVRFGGRDQSGEIEAEFTGRGEQDGTHGAVTDELLQRHDIRIGWFRLGRNSIARCSTRLAFREVTTSSWNICRASPVRSACRRNRPPLLPNSPADAAPPLTVALQQQLGLKVVPKKEQVEILMIDHVERPSAN